MGAGLSVFWVEMNEGLGEGGSIVGVGFFINVAHVLWSIWCRERPEEKLWWHCRLDNAMCR